MGKKQVIIVERVIHRLEYFIYSILDDGIKGEDASTFLVAVQRGRIGAYTSVLTFDEIVYIVSKIKGLEAAIEAGHAFLNFANLRLIDTTKPIAMTAIETMKKYGLKPRDCIHYATMEENNLTEIASEDKDFDKIGVHKEDFYKGPC